MFEPVLHIEAAFDWRAAAADARTDVELCSLLECLPLSAKDQIMAALLSRPPGKVKNLPSQYFIQPDIENRYVTGYSGAPSCTVDSLRLLLSC